jgi:hypothetical protein
MSIFVYSSSSIRQAAKVVEHRDFCTVHAEIEDGLVDVEDLVFK